MSDIKNGGPAFPVGSGDMRDPTGMTLRDYFAAKAMQCYMHDVVWNTSTYESASKAAYAVADAMLKASEAK